MQTNITIKQLDELRKNYESDNTKRIIQNALLENDINSISKKANSINENPNLFSIDIETLPAVNQKKTGRCWLFSSMNILREKLAKKYNIKGQFELSLNYLAFYDKLEKINYFLETVIKEKDTPLNSEVMRYVLANAVSDGGQWDMMVSLVKKYGICPKNAMNETYQSTSTRKMNSLINRRLRKFAADTKKTNDLASLKEECLNECFNLLAVCFGLPPKSFTFEYVDKNNEYHAIYDVTPLDFYKMADYDLDDYIGIINSPTKDKPYYDTFTVKYLGNVVDTDNEVFFLNLPMDEFKNLILSQLKDHELVWFGCDCGKDPNRSTGLWDDEAYDYQNTFGIKLDMSKEDMLDTLESAMNHAMVITGVNLKDNKPTRWKIENSWGEEAGTKGYFSCSDSWFDKYVFEAVVNKKYLNEKQLNSSKKSPKLLDPWDPFGSLAD